MTPKKPAEQPPDFDEGEEEELKQEDEDEDEELAQQVAARAQDNLRQRLETPIDLNSALYTPIVSYKGKNARFFGSVNKDAATTYFKNPQDFLGLKKTVALIAFFEHIGARRAAVLYAVDISAEENFRKSIGRGERELIASVIQEIRKRVGRTSEKWEGEKGK